MGYDSFIKIKKDDIPYIKKLLISQGFVEMFEDKPNKLYECFLCKYIDDNFKYYEGTSFSVIKSKGKYYLCGRNSVSCSSFDLKLHNDTLLFLSEALNKDFDTDEGHNVLFEYFDSPYGMVNALAFPFSALSNKFTDALYFFNNVKPLSKEQIGLNKLFGGYTLFNQESFSINLLLTYFASTLECYFKDTFRNILKCLSPLELRRIELVKEKPPYVKKMLKAGEIDVYTAITYCHSFQNIDSVVKVYKNCFKIDLQPCLDKVGIDKKNRFQILDDVYSVRHENVHMMRYEYKSYKGFLKSVAVMCKTLNNIYKYLCGHFKVRAIEYPLYFSSYKKMKKVLEQREYTLEVKVEK